MPASTDFRKATFGQRILARTLDGALVTLVALPFRGTSVWPAAMAGLLILMVYEGSTTELFGATAGKLVMGTRIRRESSAADRITGARAAARIALVGLGPSIAVVVSVPQVAIVWIVVMGAPAMFGTDHRGLHDRIAETTVVDTPDE